MSKEFEFSQELRDMLSVGNKVRDNKKVLHILAIVDDEFIVYKYWTKGRRWAYVVEYWYHFHLLLEKGWLEIVL